MQLGSAFREFTIAEGAQAALTLPFLILELAPLRWRATFVKLKSLRNVAPHLEAEFAIVPRYSFDLGTNVFKNW